MKLFKFILVPIIVVLFVSSCNGQATRTEKPKPSKTTQKTSSVNPLQAVLDKYAVDVEKYYQLAQTLKNTPSNIGDSLKKLESINTSLYQSLDEHFKQKVDLDNKQHSNIKNHKIDKKIELKIKKEQKIIDKLTKKISLNDKKIKELKYLEKQKKLLIQQKQRYKSASLKIQKESTKLIGEVSFTYNGEIYYGFIADLSKHRIETYLKPIQKAKVFSSIGNLKKYLDKNKDTALMITNAGMYTSKQLPEGLLISHGKQVSPIDLGKASHLNFYLLPNGVFYIQDNKAFILETHHYDSLARQNKIKARVATQSGPLLVINGQHHPAFNYGSKSKKLRSGVGILPNGNVLFLISKNQNTNFFQFATIFKDVFACQNALFLDGVISRMYLRETNPKEKGGAFGPMIVVTNKKIKK